MRDTHLRLLLLRRMLPSFRLPTQRRMSRRRHVHGRRCGVPKIRLLMRAGLPPNPGDLLRRRRNPLGGFPRRNLLNVHGIQLLERAALALENEEVHQQAANDVAPREHISVSEVNRAGNEGGEEGQQEVPQPVARGAEGHALCAVAAREQFADDGPDHRPPSGGEAEDEEAGEADHGDAGFRRVLRSLPVQAEVSDGREDQEADEHPGGAGHQRFAPAVVLDYVEPVERRSEVDSVQYHLRDETEKC